MNFKKKHHVVRDIRAQTSLFRVNNNFAILLLVLHSMKRMPKSAGEKTFVEIIYVINNLYSLNNSYSQTS